MATDGWQPDGFRMWRPSREQQEMERNIDRMLRGQLGVGPVGWRAVPEGMGWIPAVDLYEKETNFLVYVELPGVSLDNVDISVSGNNLTLKGERKAPPGAKPKECQQ